MASISITKNLQYSSGSLYFKTFIHSHIESQTTKKLSSGIKTDVFKKWFKIQIPDCWLSTTPSDCDSWPSGEGRHCEEGSLLSPTANPGSYKTKDIINDSIKSVYSVETGKEV